MQRIQQLRMGAVVQVLTGGTLTALWLIFAIAHVVNFNNTGKISVLAFAAAETVIALFFLLRTQPKSISNKPVEWLVAASGTFFPLLLRPEGEVVTPIAEWGLIIGSLIQIAGVISLNRSFAIVPALRELKTTGMYRVVRHPIYLGYLVTFSFYLASNFSLPNLLVFSASISLLVARLYLEEQHLGQTPEYRSYWAKVRWRLIPFVF